MKNLYNILGVEKDATHEDVKQAYRKLAMKYHPDRNQDNIEESEQKMKEITHAYYILSDEGRRMRYDHTGSTSNLSSRQTAAYDEDFEQWYNEFRNTKDYKLLESITGILFSFLAPRSKFRDRQSRNEAREKTTKVMSLFIKKFGEK